MQKTALLFFLLLAFISNGQNSYYSAPVKIPMLLSGNFAELRSNHFHSGIDIKTQGKTNVPVYAVADGYISRIAVSPSGFGKSVYIDHPNGTTSVYGHLNSFREDISEFVIDAQYDKKSFRINLIPDPGQFPIQQNDLIALSGNTGSSGGPHLHFEIRDTESEEPLNPLKYHFEITDKTAPKIFSLMVVPLNNESQVNYKNENKIYPVVLYDGNYHLKGNPIVPVYGEVGFAINTNDYIDGSWNKCGIYSLELFVDDELISAFQYNRFSFSESKYINSHIVYDEYVTSKKHFQKTWIDPGNKLDIYAYLKEDGKVTVSNEQEHRIKIILKDAYGNTSTLKFNIEGKSTPLWSQKENPTVTFKYNQSNNWETKDFKISIDKNNLYKDLDFEYKQIPAEDLFYSDIHLIHENTTPIHKYAQIEIKEKNLPKKLISKALVISIDTLTEKLYASGGEFNNGWMKTNIRNFGVYAVTVDTIHPEIIPLSISNKATLTESSRIRFKISDDLSGIKTIEGYLDEQWSLFDYDAKSNIITHIFDSKRFELNKRHNFVLKLTDYRNNTATYEASFWK